MFGRKTKPFLSATRDDDGGMTVVIDTDQIESPEIAGIILADIANHLAGAMTHSGKATDQESALIDILTLFEAELRSPTDTPTGSMMT